MQHAQKIIVRKPRPDFRVFVDLLYERGQNVDTDGDAVPVWSREWRYLYLRAREDDAPGVQLHADSSDPALFSVESESVRLRELAATYLYLFCGESIEIDGRPMTGEAVRELELKYSHELEKAASSVWHQSSADDPYPGPSKV